MVDTNFQVTKEGTHGVMVDEIRSHRSVWWVVRAEAENDAVHL